MELTSQDVGSATLTVTPAGGELSTVPYSQLRARVCLLGTDTCTSGFCVPSAAGQACAIVFRQSEWATLAPGSTFTATAVAAKDEATGLESKPAIQFTTLYP